MSTLFQIALKMEAINWDNGYPHYQAWVGCGRQYVEPACVHKGCDEGFYGSDGGFWIEREFSNGRTNRKWYCTRKCAKWTAKQLCNYRDRSCLCGG
ncbi:hypothetical protein FOXYSP1_12919 [Fusarium oxysporum f. sp. phaseoli]